MSSSKILAHYAENEHFPPSIPRSLFYAAPCDIVIRHGRGRGSGPRSYFALTRVVQSINVHCLPQNKCEIHNFLLTGEVTGKHVTGTAKVFKIDQ